MSSTTIRPKFLSEETRVSLAVLNKEIDDALHKQTIMEVKKLQHERDTIERTIFSYEEASATKLDTKAQDKLDFFAKEVNKAEAKLEREKKLLEEKFEKYRDYCNSQIEQISGKKPSDPERIIRAKIQLRELNGKLSFKETILSKFQEIEETGNPCVHILPERWWAPNPELEKELMAKLEIARANCED